MLKSTVSQLNIWDINQDAATVNQLPERTWYGIVQDQGGPPGRAVHIPERPFFVIQDEDTNAVEEIFVDWFGERLAAHNFRKGII
jgi:phage gpG-like protein